MLIYKIQLYKIKNIVFISWTFLTWVLSIKIIVYRYKKIISIC